MANPSRPPPSDSELIGQSRAGDHQAFRQLVERYHGRLLATALGMLGSGPDAEEVVQETFIRFFRSLARFEGRSSLGTYLTRIAMNEAVKVIRRRRRWQGRFFSRDNPNSPLVDPVEFPAASPVEQQERHAAIREAVQTLKAPFRDVVVLRFLNGYSTAECARILDIPQGTVMSRLTRALEKIGPALKGLKEL